MELLRRIEPNGLKVFSCFHCGGGSSLGYKLAGYKVLGGVEIDPDMMAIYRANHRPAHSYLMGVQDFIKIPDDDLPPELFDLDILDGSPPCSSFSMAGSREKKWGEAHKFREGQTHQVLDDLFFSFIRVAQKLRPRVVIAENVRGLIAGKARGYVKEIFKAFEAAGYTCQLFLLNASRMGVPQRRERVFFLARRDDLPLPPLSLDFREPVIPFAAVDEGERGVPMTGMSARARKLWRLCKPGKPLSSVHPKGSCFTHRKVHPKRAALTLTARATDASQVFHWRICRTLSKPEVVGIQTFPIDFDFGKESPGYVCGMSVPPLMMQRLALEVGRQWFGVPYDTTRRPAQTDPQPCADQGPQQGATP